MDGIEQVLLWLHSDDRLGDSCDWFVEMCCRVWRGVNYMRLLSRLTGDDWRSYVFVQIRIE